MARAYFCDGLTKNAQIQLTLALYCLPLDSPPSAKKELSSIDVKSRCIASESRISLLSPPSSEGSMFCSSAAMLGNSFWCVLSSLNSAGVVCLTPADCMGGRRGIDVKVPDLRLPLCLALLFGKVSVEAGSCSTPPPWARLFVAHPTRSVISEFKVFSSKRYDNKSSFCFAFSCLYWSFLCGKSSTSDRRSFNDSVGLRALEDGAYSSLSLFRVIIDAAPVDMPFL